MNKETLKRQFAHFLSLVLAFSFFLNIPSSYAIYDGERSPIGYSDNSHMCSTGDFKFDPGGSNIDLEWKLDNPICITFIAIQGALIMGAGIAVRALCVPTNTYGLFNSIRENAEESATPDTPLITPLTIYKMGSRLARCGARTYENALAQSQLASCMSIAAATLGGSSATCIEPARQAGLATADQIRCCAAYASYAAAVGLGMAALAIIYASAKGAYEKGRVCGHDWNVWKQVDDNGDFDSALEKTRWRLSKYPGSYQYCIEDLFIGHEDPNNSQNIIYNSCGLTSVDGIAADAVDIRNKYYREYLYGGKEFEDQSSGNCSNPSSWDEAHKKQNLGYSGNNQRYYMTGPGVASNYACHRYVLESATDPAVSAAYDCCKRRSQDTICIENAPMGGFGGYDHTFCEVGSRCSVKGIIFETYSSKIANNFACAKTYSVCPYNHLLGGGTETAVYKNNPDGTPTSDLNNFCQYRKHCVKIPVLPYIRISDLNGAYIAAACRNMKGDSQNNYGFNSEILPISSHGFSAPLVQCFKETIENALLNRAGDTKCRNPDEVASNNVCTSGYFYKKDQPLDEGQSFFAKIQNALRGAIKMALTASVIILGVVMLAGGQTPNKKQLLTYLMKIGLVMYFALGDGWQFGFVNGILSSSNYISDIMMRIDDSTTDPSRLDGCQFPRYNYSDVSNTDSKYNNPAYPPGREYLKIWDTLDCKLARAIGFGPELSVPNLVKMIFAGFLTGGLGIMFLIGTFMLAFFMLSVVIRAMHIFLMASIAIVLLIYVSPIVVTLAMFERTKGIFDGWWKQILGLSLQPVILFAYLGVYISIFNHVMVGDVSYRGDGRSVPKSVVCSSQAKDNSIYCIFGIADIGTFSGLEVIGIGLPVLGSMNQTKLNAIIKGAFIMFIFAGFMDKISTLAAELVGGAQLKSNSMSAMDMAKKSFGALAAVQQRALRGMKKHVIDKAPAVAGKIKDRVYAAAFKGMQAKPSIEGKSNDNATQSGGDSAKDKAESSAPRDAATSTPSDASKSESSTKHSEADSSKAHVAPTNDEKFSDASKKGGDDGSAMLF